MLVKAVLAICALVGLVVARVEISSQPEPSNFDELQYPTDSLANDIGNLYHLTPNLLPGGRVKHTTTYSEPYVIVMGGYDTDGTHLDDIHMYDTRMRKWTGVILKRKCCNYADEVIETLPDQDASPQYSPYNDSLAPHRIGVGWEGDLPVARAEHAAAAYNNYIYVYGGHSQDYGILNDLYRFDPFNLEWYALTNYQGPVPDGRAGHCLVTDHATGKLYLFGGRSYMYTSDTYYALNGVWEYDIARNTWDFISHESTDSKQRGQAVDEDNSMPLQPEGRQYAACGIINSVLFVYGGQHPTSHLLYDDVWAFYIGTRTWIQVLPSSNDKKGYAPPPLQHAYFIPIPGTSNSTGWESTKLVLYGGIGGGGYCGGKNCEQQETSIGQAYMLPIQFGSYDMDNSSSPTAQLPPAFYDKRTGQVSEDMKYVGLDGLEWTYMRLSDNTDKLHSDLNWYRGGRSIKTYAMESSCFDAKRGILYEFGGMYAAHDDLKYGQHVRSDFEQLQHSLAEEVGRRTQPAMGDTGGGMIGGSGDKR